MEVASSLSEGKHPVQLRMLKKKKVFELIIAVLVRVFSFPIHFQVKGLVKQHIDSFNYFINVEVSVFIQHLHAWR